MINTMRNEHIKFQMEMKSTLTELQSTQLPGNNKAEGSTNHPGTSSPGMIFFSHDDLGKGFGGGLIAGGLKNGGVLGEIGKGIGGSYATGGSGGGPGNWRYRKLDMPVFDGEDPDGWILRVERYFAFYRLTEEEMLEAVGVAMDGDALRWYQWENKRRPIRRWSDLKSFILRQFRSINGGSLYEQWLSTIQTTTVCEYRRRFIETASPLDRVSEDVLLGQFIHGLKEEIKVEVRMLSPVNLEQAMELAMKVEEKQQVSNYRRQGLGSIKTGTYSSFSKSTTTVPPYSFGPANSHQATRNWGSNYSESQASVQSPKSVSPVSKTVGEVRILTEKELQEKWAKGLCYICDYKWVIGHKCRKRELSVLLMEDEEEEADGYGTETFPPPTEEINTEVSLNSVIGLSNPKTMKLRGLVGNLEVVVMIDPGATHNFLSLNVIKAGGINVIPAGSFGVSLGNGEAIRIRGEGVCKAVRLHLDGGLEVEEDFLPLELGSSDVILGIQWLEKLGVVLTNWNTQVMKFEVASEPVTLVGDPTLVKSSISFKAMLRALRKGAGGFWVECNQMETHGKQGESQLVSTVSYQIILGT